MSLADFGIRVGGKRIRVKFVELGALLLLLAMPALAQTNDAAAGGLSIGQRAEKARWDCIQNRRIICGKILKVLPDGLVIDSGYTNLMRSPLNRSWLIPGTVQAQPAANLIEANEANSVCIGLVFLTDPPRRPVPKVYDYVNLTAYPTGRYTYTSVGELRRTVRRFSAKISKAVQWKIDQSESRSAP